MREYAQNIQMFHNNRVYYNMAAVGDRHHGRMHNVRVIRGEKEERSFKHP